MTQARRGRSESLGTDSERPQHSDGDGHECIRVMPVIHDHDNRDWHDGPDAARAG